MPWYQAAVAATSGTFSIGTASLGMVVRLSQQQDQGVYRDQDSAMAMMDPSCVVKQPEQPKDYYEAQRESDSHRLSDRTGPMNVPS